MAAPTLIASYVGGLESAQTSHTVTSVVVQTNDIILVMSTVPGTAPTISASDNASGGTNTYTAGTLWGDAANGRARIRPFWARAKASETLTVTVTHDYDVGGSCVLVVRGCPTAGSPILLENGDYQTVFGPTQSFSPGAVPGACLAVTFFASTYIVMTSITCDVGTGQTAVPCNTGLTNVKARAFVKTYNASQSSETWTGTSNSDDFKAAATVYLDGVTVSGNIAWIKA